MPIISFVTQKGGSGKSTLAINCAVAAEQAGRRVMLLDMDEQRTAEQWFQAREAETPQIITLQSAELKGALELARIKKFDWVLIDTPGRDTPGTSAAIRAADLCVIPCRPSPADIQAIKPTVEAVRRANKAATVVLMQTPARSYSTRIEESKEGLSKLISVCPFNIVSRAVYQDALGAGYGVTEFDPHGKAAEEISQLWKWISNQARKANYA